MRLVFSSGGKQIPWKSNRMTKAAVIATVVFGALVFMALAVSEILRALDPLLQHELPLWQFGLLGMGMALVVVLWRMLRNNSS